MKTKQALVIGLGQFGVSLVQSLEKQQVEVLAVDRNQARVDEIASIATKAACFDAADEKSLAKTAPNKRDFCVCAIGDDGREAAFLCTALLRQLGAKRIIARGIDPLHERIMRSIGAQEVVNPERAFGEQLASQLIFSSIRGETPIGENLMITELEAPSAIVGHSLSTLQLRKKHGITVAAINREQRVVASPDPHDKIQKGDLLIVLSSHENVVNFLQRVE